MNKRPASPHEHAPVSRRGVNRGSNVAKLPPEIHARFVRFFREGVGYIEICDRLNPIIDQYNEDNGAQAPRLSIAGISRWWKSVEGPAAKEALARAKDVEHYKAMMEAGLESGDAFKAIAGFIETTLLRRAGTLQDESAKDLGYLLTAIKGAQARRMELELKEKRLEQESERLRFQVESYKAKLAQDNDLQLPPPDRVFAAVAARILGVLRTYAELRPLLDKFSRNVSVRLANEAERFDFSEVLNA